MVYSFLPSPFCLPVLSYTILRLTVKVLVMMMAALVERKNVQLLIIKFFLRSLIFNFIDNVKPQPDPKGKIETYTFRAKFNTFERNKNCRTGT